jgi:hypothetical protein
LKDRLNSYSLAQSISAEEINDIIKSIKYQQAGLERIEHQLPHNWNVLQEAIKEESKSDEDMRGHQQNASNVKKANPPPQ